MAPLCIFVYPLLSMADTCYIGIFYVLALSNETQYYSSPRAVSTKMRRLPSLRLQIALGQRIFFSQIAAVAQSSLAAAAD